MILNVYFLKQYHETTADLFLFLSRCWAARVAALRVTGGSWTLQLATPCGVSGSPTLSTITIMSCSVGDTLVCIYTI